MPDETGSIIGATDPDQIDAAAEKAARKQALAMERQESEIDALRAKNMKRMEAFIAQGVQPNATNIVLDALIDLVAPQGSPQRLALALEIERNTSDFFDEVDSKVAQAKLAAGVAPNSGLIVAGGMPPQ